MKHVVLGQQCAKPSLITTVLFACLGTTYALGQANAPTPIDANVPVPQFPGPTTDVLQSDPINSLAYVNTNASSVQNIDRQHGPFSAGVEVRGSYTDNLFNSPNFAKSGPYWVGSAPVGYRWFGGTSAFAADYRIDGAVYPGYSELNSISQVYLQRWEHKRSERASYFWDLTGGRVTSLGQYLPALLPVGNTGVAQPTQPPTAGNVLQNSYIISNADTALGLNYKLSEKDSFAGTLTGGWLEQAEQGTPVRRFPLELLRSEPAALDLQGDHLLTPKTALGAEVTGLYVRGLAPLGHELYTAVEGTYKHNFSSYLGLRAAAGPLFNVYNVRRTGGNNEFSYLASAAIDYNTLFARMSAEFSRVIQLQYLGPPTIANQISGIFDRAVSRNMDLTLDARYINAPGNATVVAQTTYGVTGRLDRYLASNLSVFVSAGRFALSLPATRSFSDSYGRDEVSGGIHYSFGAPLQRQRPSR